MSSEDSNDDEQPPPYDGEAQHHEPKERNFAPEILKAAEAPELAGLRQPQRLLYALLHAGLREAASGSRYGIGSTLLATPVRILRAVVVGLFWFGLMIYLVTLAATYFGAWVNWGLYLIPVMLLLLALVVRWGSSIDSSTISLNYKDHTDDAPAMNLSIGKISDLAHGPNQWAAGGGAVFAMEWCMLWLAHDNLGIDVAGGFLGAFWLTVDNLCHGVFLDTFELYGLGVAEPVPLNWLTATVFFGFRLSYDACLLMFLIELYQFRNLARVLDDYPANPPGDASPVSTLAAWIQRTSAAPKDWSRHHVDEFQFLFLCSLYLRGKYADVFEFSRHFAKLSINEDVRELFLDESDYIMIAHLE